jgi:carboxymethylenebutenolidase
MGDTVEFPSNGSMGAGYLAVPESGSGPGVVVIQEWWGLAPHIKDVCDRFAAEGFVALAPDLYHGELTTEPDEAGKLMMALNLERAAKDLGGAVTEVARRGTGNGVGVVGFCMGGGLALWLASLNPELVKAVVPFYGVIPWEAAQPDYSRMEAAVLGHYGSADAFLPVEGVEQLEQQLRDLGKDVEIHFYEGLDHAFFNDTRPEVHDAEAAKTAWSRTVDFLNGHLGG